MFIKEYEKHKLIIWIHCANEQYFVSWFVVLCRVREAFEDLVACCLFSKTVAT